MTPAQVIDIVFHGALSVGVALGVWAAGMRWLDRHQFIAAARTAARDAADKVVRDLDRPRVPIMFREPKLPSPAPSFSEQLREHNEHFIAVLREHRSGPRSPEADQ